jgi:hypothetical protein
MLMKPLCFPSVFDGAGVEKRGGTWDCCGTVETWLMLIAFRIIDDSFLFAINIDLLTS